MDRLRVPPDRSRLPWREAVRAVVLDPDRRILLVHFDFVGDDIPNGFWACPGGGKNPDESDAQALRRELREEVGLELGAIGPPIWDKNYTWPAGAFSGQHDVFYLVRSDSFTPAGRLDAAALKSEHVDEIRWWTWEELQSTYRTYSDSDPATPGYTVFSPRLLVPLLRELFDHGTPRTPVLLLDR
jgi:8-oxo-dGTP pyrophosphatase MutT (NUDIX family)